MSIDKFKIFNFANNDYVPQFKIKKGKYPHLEWKNGNDEYPDYLLNIYNFDGSSLHHSIINKKVMMIASEGIIPTNQNTLAISNGNGSDLNEELYKMVYDGEVFNGFAFEVILSNDKKSVAQINHIPIKNVRIGVDEDGTVGDYYWISDDWSDVKKNEPVVIPAYDKNSKENKQLVMYQYYNPQNLYYPSPYYFNALNSIELQNNITTFHLHNAKNGYAPSLILNLPNIATEEEQDLIYSDMRRNFEGPTNAGKMFLTFNDGEDAPSLDQVSLNDSDERFILLKDQIQEDILTSHQINGILAGISTSGSLGDKNLMEDAITIFNATYVTKRQVPIERLMTELLGVEIKFKDFKLEKIVKEEKGNDINAQKQAELRGSVGGVQGLLQIQQSVEAGTTSRNSAIATLELIYGFNREEAMRLLGDVQEGDNNNLITE